MTVSMDDDLSAPRRERLDELLDRWEDARDKGRPLTVEELCADDPDLKGAAEHLVRRLEATDRYTRNEQRGEQDDEPTPTHAGPYRVIEVIGGGGMGIVYRCLQEKPHREIAVKTIRRKRLSNASRDQFVREANVLGLLRHPGIAHVYEAGDDDRNGGGQPYIAMELVSGPRLDQYVRTHGLDVREIVRLILKVCDAVSYAHGEGVLHLDLKPANILVVDGEPKVLDFGIARVTTFRLRGEREDRDAARLVGSLAYMSPEQVCERIVPDERSDVHSLGVVLYELLTGLRPIVLADASVPEAVERIRRRKRPLLGRTHPKYRGDLEKIIDKAMAINLDDRYSTVAELSNDLRCYLDGLPVSARPVSRMARAARACRRNSTVSFLAATCLGLLIAVAIIAAWQRPATRPLITARDDVAANERLDSNERSNTDDVSPGVSRRVPEDGTEATGGGADTDVTSGAAQPDQEERGDTHETLLHAQQIGPRDPVSAIEMLDDPRLCPVDDRAFTWRWLRYLFDHEVLEIKAHGAVYSLDFSPDGETIVALGANGQIRGWCAVTGQERFIRAGTLHRKPAKPVFFGSRSRIAACAGENEIRMLDMDGTALRSRLAGHSRTLTALAASPDGRTLVSADDRGTINVWDLPTGRLLRSLPRDGGPVTALAFRPDGSLVAAGRRPGIECWEVRSGVRKAHFPCDLRSIGNAVFSPDARWLATSDRSSRTLFVWDVSAGRLAARVPLTYKSYSRPAFSPDGRWLAAGVGGTVRIYSTTDWSFRYAVGGHDENVRDLAFSPDGARLASGGKDKMVRIWDVRPDRDVTTLLVHTGDIVQMRTIPGTDLAVVAANDGALWLVDARGAPPRVLPSSRPGAQRCAVSRDGRYLAIRSPRRGLAVHEIPTGTLACSSPLFDDPIESVAFHDATESLIVSTRPGKLYRWRLATSMIEPLWSERDFEAAQVACCGVTGELIVATRAATLLRGCPLDDSSPIREIPLDSPASCLSLSADGRRLAVGCFDGAGILFARPEMTVAARLTGFGRPVRTLDFSTDGRTLVSASRDGTTMLWDGVTGRLQMTIAEPLVGSEQVRFAADGAALLACTRDGRVVRYGIPADARGAFSPPNAARRGSRSNEEPVVEASFPGSSDRRTPASSRPSRAG